MNPFLLNMLSPSSSAHQGSNFLSVMRFELMTILEDLFEGLSASGPLKNYFTDANAESRKSEFIESFIIKCKTNPNMNTEEALSSVVGDLVVTMRKKA